MLYGPSSVAGEQTLVLTKQSPCLPVSHSSASYTTANAESDYERDSDRESEDGEDEVSCETVKMGRKDSLDLDVEVASGPASAAVEAAGSSVPEDMLLLLQQADELHRGSELNRREGFQLLLNNKLAVRLQMLAPCLLCPSLRE